MKAKPTVCYVVSASGGVGKSTFCRVLAYYFKEILRIKNDKGELRKPRVRLIDYDRDNTNLARCEPQAFEYDARCSDEYEASFDLLASSVDFFVCDTPAGSVNSLVRDIGSIGAFKKLHRSYEILVFLVVNSTQASKRAITDLQATWKDVRKIIVLAEHEETFDFSFLRLEKDIKTMPFVLMPKKIFMKVDKENKSYDEYLRSSNNSSIFSFSNEKIVVEQFIKRNCEAISSNVFLK